jgi:hypothetical protein
MLNLSESQLVLSQKAFSPIISIHSEIITFSILLHLNAPFNFLSIKFHGTLNVHERLLFLNADGHI